MLVEVGDHPDQSCGPQQLLARGSGDRIIPCVRMCRDVDWGRRRAPRWWASPGVGTLSAGTPGGAGRLPDRGAQLEIRRAAVSPGGPVHAGRQGEGKSWAILVHANQHSRVFGWGFPPFRPLLMRRREGASNPHGGAALVAHLLSRAARTVSTPRAIPILRRRARSALAGRGQLSPTMPSRGDDSAGHQCLAGNPQLSRTALAGRAAVPTYVCS